MQCHEVIQLLSAYYDDELPPDRATVVKSHVESCRDCAAELESFRKMSDLTSQLYQPPPPPHVWHRIATQLDADVAQAIPKARISRCTRRIALLALAASVAVGVPWLGHNLWHSHADHHLAMNFGQFLGIFEQSPEQAQDFLAQKYSGRRVTFADAVRELKYRPIVTDRLLLGYELTQANLLNMPCCRCLEVCYRRKNGGMVCIFEHDEAQPIWFDDRPVSDMVCSGKFTRLVRGDSWIAASWQHQRRHITVIGAKDIDEVKRIVAHFEQPAITSPL